MEKKGREIRWSPRDVASVGVDVASVGVKGHQVRLVAVEQQTEKWMVPKMMRILIITTYLEERDLFRREALQPRAELRGGLQVCRGLVA